MSIKVKLRLKKITGDRHSLYLDYYPPVVHPDTGNLTRREFLGFYLFDKPTTASEKQHNKDTVQRAEHIRMMHDNQLNKPEIYTEAEKQQLKIKEKGEQSFVEYFLKLTQQRQTTNHDNWVSAYHYLFKFTKGKLKFTDLDEKFCNDFKHYLCTTPSNKSTKALLSQNSAFSYFNKLKAALKQAYRDGILQYDLNVRVDRLKEAESKRNFLTLEELNNLVKAECPDIVLKNAAIFSALTGLRYSDIEKLVWDEVEYTAGQGYSLNFRQQKTRGVEYLPIADQAHGLMGEPGLPTAKVFKGLKYSATMNVHLLTWLNSAKITKKITFHCFRHTYATLQLFNGTSLYTVSKMLGHREIKTTQVYAKIIDQTKRDATDKIKLTF